MLQDDFAHPSAQIDSRSGVNAHGSVAPAFVARRGLIGIVDKQQRHRVGRRQAMNGLTLAYQVAGLAWAEAGPTQAAVHAGSAHGFSTAQIIDLMRAGLATARAERFVVGGGRIEVARVRITEAGKRACAKYE